jgi:2-polyprenyl-3-methyl-5-hydroxy-6-metoxy-1,4-benzoquinol methylase
LQYQEVPARVPRLSNEMPATTQSSTTVAGSLPAASPDTTDTVPATTDTDAATTFAAANCPGCGESLRGRVLLSSHDRLMGGPGEFTVLACGACGLASTQPRLRPEQFADYYPQVYYPARAERLSFAERLRLEWIVRLGPYRRLARLRPGRMLDVGCGSGALLSTFAGHGWSVAGVEPSVEAAARALAAGIEMHNGTLDDAPWEGPTFDAIVFNHSLEHIPDPVASLRQAAALLRDGGTLAVAVPNFDCWQRRLFGARWFQLDLPRHLQHMQTHTLAALFERAGLRPVARTTVSMRPALLLSLQYAAFGRVRSNGRGLRLAAWAMAPLLWALDRFADGDCLHMFAVRQED